MIPPTMEVIQASIFDQSRTSGKSRGLKIGIGLKKDYLDLWAFGKLHL